jgi:predicted Holliday junction resolvase-like endonuclease
VSAIGLILFIVYLIYLNTKQNKKHKELIVGYKNQVESYKKLVPDVGAIIPMSHFREVVDSKSLQLSKTEAQLSMVEKELQELKSQQQSKSVRLGLISENVLPFNSEFKYNVKDLVPMFRPIDYIVFAEDEIIFLEIKVGTSQLSEKQKKIRNLVQQGKVRFEEHRVNETGYSIKENHGKTQS